MRTFGVLFAYSAVACLVTTHAFGQGAAQRPAEEQFEPYHQHHDTHLGHDHFYPDRGSIVREAPQGAITVSYAGLSYRFHDGVWYEPRGPAFMVVAPPIGLVVPTLPAFTTVWAHGGEVYLYCNDVYYQPRPDLGGYEIVNDPTSEPTPKAKAAALPAALPSPQPAGTRMAVATAPEVDADETPPTVAPYTVPSATAATPGSALRVAAKIMPDPAPASAVMPAVAKSQVAPAAVPAVATSTASLAPGTAATAATVPVLTAATATNTAPSAVTYAPAPTTSAPAAPPPAPATAPNISPAPAAGAVAPTYATPPAAPAPAIAPVPALAAATPTAPPKGIRADVVPRNNQGPEQLAKDRYECYQFAVKESGYDPIHSSGAAPQQQYDYDRAQSGCFDARGYSVR